MIIAGILLLLLLCLFYASYSIEAGIYIKAFCRQKTNGKVVAITFDDGPDSKQTPQVLDVLKEYNASATFFCIGSKITGNEAIIQRMVTEKHTVGNHSFTHSAWFPLYSANRMMEDLRQCENVLEPILNKKTDWFRPPFGVTNPTIAKAVKRLGYTTIGWNIRTLDTQSLSHEKIIARIRRQLRPGSVILLHDRMPQSELLLRKVLDLLKAEQYKVVGLETMTEASC